MVVNGDNKFTRAIDHDEKYIIKNYDINFFHVFTTFIKDILYKSEQIL